MFEDNRLAKVRILMEQQKYQVAKGILEDLLREDPNDIGPMVMLVEIFLQEEKLEQAKNMLANAMGLAPDQSYLFYLQCRIAVAEKNMDEAEAAIQQALELDPSDADYFALWAHIKLVRKQYEAALEKANIALGIDAENLLALNIRSGSLIKLNRKEESYQTIEGALREDPNNAFTHANYGWSLLEKGAHKKAFTHFEQALQNDPNMEFAQAGMREAIKATNPVYRLFLKYVFWIGKMSAKNQWVVILGFYFGYRFLNALASNNDALAPFLNPILVILAIIAFSTWVLEPLSNLFLRFHRFGNILLSKKQKLSSNFVAVSLLVSINSLIISFVLPDERFLYVAFFAFGMMMPFGFMFRPTRFKNAMVYYTIALGCAGILGLVVLFRTWQLDNTYAMVFLFGLIAFQWIANFLAIQENNL